MTLDEFEQRYARPVIACLSAYEAVAITSRRLPTVTAMVKRLHSHPLGQVLLWQVFGWVSVHFFRAVCAETENQ